MKLLAIVLIALALFGCASQEQANPWETFYTRSLSAPIRSASSVPIVQFADDPAVPPPGYTIMGHASMVSAQHGWSVEDLRRMLIRHAAAVGADVVQWSRTFEGESIEHVPVPTYSPYPAVIGQQPDNPFIAGMVRAQHANRATGMTSVAMTIRRYRNTAYYFVKETP